MIKILSTKNLSEEEIVLGRTFGWRIDCKPFIGIKEIKDSTVAEKIQAYLDVPIVAIFTSQNSVEFVRNKLPNVPVNWKVICISGATQRAVEYWLGQSSILFSGKNASEIKGMLHLFKRDKVVYFCGTRRLDTLPIAFEALEMNVDELMLYETVMTESTTTEEYDIYMFYSPSGVDSFFTNNEIGENKLVVSIGPTTEAAIRRHYAGTIVVSDEPKLVGMYQKINEFYVKK